MTRGRKVAPAADTHADNTNHEAIAKAGEALDELAQRSAEIAERFDDGLPYDRNRMVSEARFYMGQSAEAMLEAGKRLIVLKENEAHGEFLDLLESRLGLNVRTAQRMMAASVKYLSPALASKATTLSLLGKSKLLELMVEDDATLEGLAEGGTVAGKNLDDIQAMSARELRAALIEARKTAAAKDGVIAKKDQKLNELTEAEELRRGGTASEREQAQLDDLRETGVAADLAVRRLLKAAAEVTVAPVTPASALAAQHTVAYLAQLMAQLIGEAGIAVDMDELITPSWLSDSPAPGRAG